MIATRPTVAAACLLAALACAGAVPGPAALAAPTSRAADRPAAQEEPPAATTTPAAAPAMAPIVISGPADANGNPVVTITLDLAAAPELREWAIRAAHHAIEWHPRLAALLASDGFEPARDITLIFKKMEGVAYRAGRTITISTKWIHDHPDDFGMIVHELTHVIQDYPRGNPGWLVEGMADYVRYYVAEPGSPRGRFNAQRQSYRSGYQPAAGLLNWLERTAGPGIVTKLNRAMRDGTYSAARFREITGDDPDVLWERFKQSPLAQPAAATRRTAPPIPTTRPSNGLRPRAPRPSAQHP